MFRIIMYKLIETLKTQKKNMYIKIFNHHHHHHHYHHRLLNSTRCLEVFRFTYLCGLVNLMYVVGGFWIFLGPQKTVG